MSDNNMVKNNNIDNIDKIERNAKAIKTIVSLLIIIAGMIYGFCIFIYQNQTHSSEISDLKTRISTLEALATAEHHKIEQKIAANEKDFQMTATKLEVSLVKISADLQFIKEHLMEKGMDEHPVGKNRSNNY